MKYYIRKEDLIKIYGNMYSQKEYEDFINWQIYMFNDYKNKTFFEKIKHNLTKKGNK